jgi:hypothetical protein
MTLAGGCYCGQIRYQTSDRVFHKTVCHCASCRRICGAPSVAWFSVAQRDFRLTRGMPARFRSSPQVTRTFCPRCGTQLTYQHARHADEIDITICSLDDPEQLAPEDHTFTSGRLGWVASWDGLPQYWRSRAEEGGAKGEDDESAN